MKVQIKLAGLLLLATFNFYPSILRAQGALTPPGAHAPTMKSLDQIEPRTPPAVMQTPRNRLARFILTQPGSFFLTASHAGVSGKQGIQILANDVTVGVDDFSLPESAGVRERHTPVRDRHSSAKIVSG